MKLALTALSLLVLLTGFASGQTSATVAADSKATVSTSFPVKVGIAIAPDGTVYSTRIINDVITAVGQFTVRNGVGAYEIDPDSIRFSGDDATINRIPTSRVYEFLAREVVVQGSLKGFTPVASNCSAPTQVKVYSKSCIVRNWQGVLTRFAPCSTEESIWAYTVCGVNTLEGMNVARVQYDNPVICPPTGGCETTCPVTTGSAPLLQ